MDQLDTVFRIFGFALCVMAMLPLALWTAQSWLALKYNRAQFRGSQELLRQQILAANQAPVAETPVGAEASLSNSSRDVANDSALADVAAAKPGLNVEVQADGSWQGFRKFRVSKLVKETSTCTSVYLSPVDGLPIASFRAGQHLPLRFQIPGRSKRVIRCYSLSDGPGKLQYRISVKAMPADQDGHEPGLVSNFINSQLRQGDIVESKSPSGSFYVDLEDSRPAILLAGGIGITPIFSMLDSIQRNSPDRPTVVFYGVRNKSEHAFGDELKRIAEANDNIHLVNCYSNPLAGDVQGTDYHVKGFVSIDLIKRLMPKPDCQFYLCGPPSFMKSLGNGLKEWGVPDSQVHSEAFGPASIASSPTAASIPAAAGAVEVVFDQTGKTVAWAPEHESLLALAEANGVEIDFGCRAGSCGTCSTVLAAGEVEYPENLQVACEPGQCLPCVARPAGSIKLGA